MLYFIICAAVSVIGSVSGIGGGIIIKPLMDSFGVLSIPAINFLSGCTVLCMSGISLLFKEEDVKIQKKVSVYLAAGASTGGIAGKELFHLIYERANIQKLIGALQTSLLLSINIGILLYLFFKKSIKQKVICNFVIYIIIGFGLGLISSFLGIGGGPINVIVLGYLFSMNPKEISLNSLFIIFCSQTASLIYSVMTKTVPVFQWRTLAVMCAGGIAGAVTGRLISKKIDKNAVEYLFICVVILLIALNIFNLSSMSH